MSSIAVKHHVSRRIANGQVLTLFPPSDPLSVTREATHNFTITRKMPQNATPCHKFTKIQGLCNKKPLDRLATVRGATLEEDVIESV